MALISRDNNPSGVDLFLPVREGVDAVIQLDEGADVPLCKGLEFGGIGGGVINDYPLS